MTWYRVYFMGFNGIRRIMGTYDKGKAFGRAHEIADSIGLFVTIAAETKTRYGMRSEYYKIYPDTYFTKN